MDNEEVRVPGSDLVDVLVGRETWLMTEEEVEEAGWIFECERCGKLAGSHFHIRGA